MDGSIQFLLLAVVYRIVAMLVGMVFVLMGYQILSRANEADRNPGPRDAWDRYRVHFGGGLAGFGALILLVTVVQGLRFDVARFERLRMPVATQAEHPAGPGAASSSPSRPQYAADSSRVASVQLPVYDPQPQFVPPEPELEPLQPARQLAVAGPQTFGRGPLTVATAPFAVDSPSVMIQRARNQQHGASAAWDNFFYRTAFDDRLEAEMFELYEVEPLWEKDDEPAVLELKLLIDDLERAGSAREPVKHRQFVLDLYKNEIVYLRRALRMAEMYDLSESRPEIFNLGNLELALNLSGDAPEDTLDGD